MGNDSLYNNGGVLSDVDIQKEMKNGNIFIAPFVQAQLQPSGYNLTPTKFFYSTKKKQFLPIVNNEEETYVMIDRNDTVLVRTRESIAISPILTGAFYSKVKVVSEGFGHVSTTLDPNWEGQLLISLNNPTNRRVKFSIEKEVYGNRICNSFVTLEFMYLNQAAMHPSDNPPGRLDILDNTLRRNISTFKKKKISDLENLVSQLHDQETKTIEYLIMQHLNEEEEKEWKQINIIRDENSYNVRKGEFIRAKKEKYLRPIQKNFALNAERSMGIVNEYIEKKQQYFSYRKRFWLFLTRNKLWVVNILICLVLAGILLRYNSIDSEKGTIYTMVSTIIIYIVIPVMLPLIDEYFKGK